MPVYQLNSMAYSLFNESSEFQNSLEISLVNLAPDIQYTLKQLNKLSMAFVLDLMGWEDPTNIFYLPLKKT